MAALGRGGAGGRFFLLQLSAACPPQLQTVFSNLLEAPLSNRLSFPIPTTSWNFQQIRMRTRGNEYQPNNRKRKRTHGWIKRISTPAGIEVILRRMLKGRKSLTH